MCIAVNILNDVFRLQNCMTRQTRFWYTKHRKKVKMLVQYARCGYEAKRAKRITKLTKGCLASVRSKGLLGNEST